MKKTFTMIGLFAMISIALNAQEFSEAVQPLSGMALKGYMYNVSKDEAGNSNITYKMKVDKKSEAVSFEKYSFDKDLKFTGTTEVQETKVQKEDKERTYYFANVGGSTSFDVLSMKLKLNKVVRLLTWNHDKQRYVTKKTISNETIKPKNDAGKVYLGYASYFSDDDAKSDLFVLAKNDTKDKAVADKFCILQFSSNLELKEKTLDLTGSYSLVYCEQLANEDVVMVFAPKKGAADASKYVYFRFDIEGNQKIKTEFASPASALAITGSFDKEGNVYFFGTSIKSAKPFEEVFNEYAPISSPGFSQGGNNYADLKWRNSINETMDNFHFLKFTGDKLDFTSTTPVADFKSKFKTAPDDKGATAYKGKKFFIESFFVTAADEYLVAGQLSSKVNMGDANIVDAYEDIICFHFDKSGNLKAQYGIGKMNNDKKSEIFEMAQDFFPSSDGISLYWELMEVKGTKGYASFMDAYNGNSSFYPLYFPRIVKIDLSNTTLGEVKVMGGEKYFLRKNFTSQFDKSENSITYLGHDESWKNLWIGKVQF
jgi:hypothetical protein